MNQLARNHSSSIPGKVASARVRVAYGTACEVEHEDRTIRVDLPPAEGGSSTGPHPAQLMRASLGASALAAARMAVARITRDASDVSVEITSESSEIRGSATPWSRLSLVVRVASSAPQDALIEAVTSAVGNSPMLALLTPDVERAIRVCVVPPTL